MTKSFMAGVSRTDITPPVGIAHAGWGAQTHQRAAGVDLPLQATALALSDGEQSVVIVDVDLCYIWDSEAPAVMHAVAELTQLPMSHIRVSYTHTHSGPINGRTWNSWIKEGAEMVEVYDRSLPHRIAGVAWQALQTMRPARIATGWGKSDIAVNRRFQRPEDGAVIVGRNWTGPVDHAVGVIRIDDLNEQPIAVIAHYACHPITVGPDNELLTPDYPGVMKRVVEQATGATCLFLQGATGNIGPIRGGARHGIHEYKRLGAMLGHEVARVWWTLETRPKREHYAGTLESGAPLAIYYDDVLDDEAVLLRVGTRTMNLPLKDFRPPAELEVAFEEHATRLNQLREQGGAIEAIKWETMLAKRAAMRADLSRQWYGKMHRTMEAQAFVLGRDIALVAIPAEPFVEIGMAVKQQSPFKHTLFSGYSNVGWAYVPMPDAYPLGGYEVEITPFAPSASTQIIEECVALLQSLR
jgi:hypothetical protein